jgi:hypothetical protein
MRLTGRSVAGVFAAAAWLALLASAGARPPAPEEPRSLASAIFIPASDTEAGDVGLLDLQTGLQLPVWRAGTNRMVFATVSFESTEISGDAPLPAHLRRLSLRTMLLSRSGDHPWSVWLSPSTEWADGAEPFDAPALSTGGWYSWPAARGFAIQTGLVGAWRNGRVSGFPTVGFEWRGPGQTLFVRVVDNAYWVRVSDRLNVGLRVTPDLFEEWRLGGGDERGEWLERKEVRFAGQAAVRLGGPWVLGAQAGVAAFREFVYRDGNEDRVSDFEPDAAPFVSLFFARTRDR